MEQIQSGLQSVVQITVNEPSGHNLQRRKAKAEVNRKAPREGCTLKRTQSSSKIPQYTLHTYIVTLPSSKT